MTSRRFEGRVAIVTGAASGIGAAIAHRFVFEGASVFATDVQTEKGEAVASACGADFRSLGVADASAWDALIAEVGERRGRLDILVNNAGILRKGGIEDLDLIAWNRRFAVNVDGVMLGCRAAIGLIKRNHDPYGGVIINTSSTAAFGAIAGDVAYTASEAAVHML
ncbi:oxidoreductase, short chain dehydrogenase [Sphingobium sp. MI1205]|nr:oxidoreductase, short chain dehydrogenase [Sphingobium sp. MI1205]